MNIRQATTDIERYLESMHQEVVVTSVRTTTFGMQNGWLVEYEDQFSWRLAYFRDTETMRPFCVWDHITEQK